VDANTRASKIEPAFYTPVGSFAGLQLLSLYLAKKMHVPLPVLIIAYFGFKQCHPSLASSLSHRLYCPRVPRFEQDEAGIPDPEGTLAPLILGPMPHGREPIGMTGTVKRGGGDLSEM
jgi:hypothetical protein